MATWTLDWPSHTNVCVKIGQPVFIDHDILLHSDINISSLGRIKMMIETKHKQPLTFASRHEDQLEFGGVKLGNGAAHNKEKT